MGARATAISDHGRTGGLRETHAGAGPPPREWPGAKEPGEMRFAIRREPFEQWGRLNVIPSERSESGDLPCGHRSQPRHEYFTLDPSTRWRSLGMTPGCRPPFG